jgi:type VI secretion system protein ImpA
MSDMLKQISSADITHTEEFQSVDAMVSAYDAEGDGPLRKGEAAFNWGSVEGLCLSLAEKAADLRVGIWLLRAALADLKIDKVLQSLERIAEWTTLSPDQLHPVSVGDDDGIHALILGWLASPAFIYGMCQLKVNASSDLTLAELETEEQHSSMLQLDEKIVLVQQLKELLNALATIEKHIFDGYSIEGRSLIRVSQLLERCLEKVAPNENVTAEQNNHQANLLAIQASGNLNSRSEVREMLMRINAYFQTHEPSHPAPIFLNRVQRMIGANFEELMDELYPDAQQLIAKIERPKAT